MGPKAELVALAGGVCGGNGDLFHPQGNPRSPTAPPIPIQGPKAKSEQLRDQQVMFNI